MIRAVVEFRIEENSEDLAEMGLEALLVNLMDSSFVIDFEIQAVEEVELEEIDSP